MRNVALFLALVPGWVWGLLFVVGLWVFGNFVNRMHAGPPKNALAKLLDWIVAAARKGADKPFTIPFFGTSQFTIPKAALDALFPELPVAAAPAEVAARHSMPPAPGSLPLGDEGDG